MLVVQRTFKMLCPTNILSNYSFFYNLGVSSQKIKEPSEVLINFGRLFYLCVFRTLRFRFISKLAGVSKAYLELLYDDVSLRHYKSSSD